MTLDEITTRISTLERGIVRAQKELQDLKEQRLQILKAKPRRPRPLHAMVPLGERSYTMYELATKSNSNRLIVNPSPDDAATLV